MLYQPNICAECWADKALAQPTRWSAFKNAVLHAIALHYNLSYGLNFVENDIAIGAIVRVSPNEYP